MKMRMRVCYVECFEAWQIYIKHAKTFQMIPNCIWVLCVECEMRLKYIAAVWYYHIYAIMVFLIMQVRAKTFLDLAVEIIK